MDAYRSQYSPPANNFAPVKNLYAPRPSHHSPPPSVYPKAETNYNPGFSVSGQSPVSSLVARPPAEIPRAQTANIYSQSPVTRPKTFAQWVAIAKENTLEVRRIGSPSPLVWVGCWNNMWNFRLFLLAGPGRRHQYSGERHCRW